MARDQVRYENPRQGAGGNIPNRMKTENKSDRNRAKQSGANASGNDAERERSIETGREHQSRSTGTAGTQSGALARSSQTSPVYGSGSGLTSPFSLVSRMAEDMDRLFEDFALGRGISSGLFDRDFGNGSRTLQSAWTPQLETFRRGDEIVVRADLPGLKKEDINVDVEDGILTISGERTDENEENRDGYYRSERSYGQFYRSIALPERADSEACEATFKDGVLEVTVKAPAEKEQNRKRIQVR